MKFEVLAGKIAAGVANSKDYTDWAMELLEQGSDSENIAILAGLCFDKYPDSFEVRDYFNRCLDELGLILPTGDEVILYYAKYICEQIIKGGIPPRDGASALYHIGIDFGWQGIYSMWLYLEEDIESLRYDEGYYLFNTGLNKQNIDQYIIKEAEQFLIITGMTLPDDFFSLCLCEKCGYLGKCMLRPLRIVEILTSRNWVYGGKIAICRMCGDTHLLSMGDHVGREVFLKKVNL